MACEKNYSRFSQLDSGNFRFKVIEHILGREQQLLASELGECLVEQAAREAEQRGIDTGGRFKIAGACARCGFTGSTTLVRIEKD